MLPNTKKRSDTPKQLTIMMVTTQLSLHDAKVFRGYATSGTTCKGKLTYSRRRTCLFFTETHIAILASYKRDYKFHVKNRARASLNSWVTSFTHRTNDELTSYYATCIGTDHLAAGSVNRYELIMQERIAKYEVELKHKYDIDGTGCW